MKRFISESLAAYLEATADVQTEAAQVLPAWMDVYKEIDDTRIFNRIAAAD